MANVEALVAALQRIAEQQSSLQEVVAQLAQSSAAFQQGSEKVLGELVKPKPDHAGKMWNDVNHYKNVKMFSGDNKEWEEFMSKLKGQIAAGSSIANNVVEHIEAKVSEGELEQGEYVERIDMEEDYDEDQITEVSHRM